MQNGATIKIENVAPERGVPPKAQKVMNKFTENIAPVH
jgi:hypothetical protein